MKFDKENPGGKKCGECVHWPKCEKIFADVDGWRKGQGNYKLDKKTFCGWSPSRFNKPDAWDLFWKMFKEGEEVCVITEDDVLLTGKLYTTERHCILIKGISKEIVDWDDVRFISHDGFPFRKLIGADGAKSIEDIDNTGICADVRKKTPTSYSDDGGGGGGLSGGKRNRHIPEPNARCHTAGLIFGDPWHIENVKAELFNPGQLWSPENWMYEETLRLSAQDGAGALLFDISTIYHFEE